jgi:hypothetical protein
MGFLFKILLLALVFYFVFKQIVSFIARITGRHTPQKGQSTRTKREGEINIDYRPEDKNGKFGGDFEGGEYVDYEEVK